MEKVSESIINIGVNDYTIDLFEGQYPVEHGMAYNSYIILDEKIAVMDTVDARASEEWITSLQKVLGDRTPDYVIVQHMEPDHSASLQLLKDMYPSVTIVTSLPASNMMKQFFSPGITAGAMIIKEGDTLSLGSHTLTFVAAPMIHWPEVMMTYEASEKIFFSADAFGRFGTRDADVEWKEEARDYYINIVGKYGMQVQKLLQKAASLDISCICPLHGPVLTGDLAPYLALYHTWSSYTPEKKGVLIACASAHGNTLTAAGMLQDILKEKNVETKLIDLTREDVHEAVSAAFEYDRLVLCAITYDGGLFPAMEHFLSLLKAKNFRNRNAVIIENGSWAPMAGKLMRAALEGMTDITVQEPVITIRSKANDANIAAFKDLAEKWS